jgi:hypothetical protein
LGGDVIIAVDGHAVTRVKGLLVYFDAKTLVMKSPLKYSEEIRR